MPTPRDSAKKTGSKLAGEPKGVDVKKGIPSNVSPSGSFKNYGSDKSNDGPAEHDAMPAKNLKGGYGG